MTITKAIINGGALVVALALVITLVRRPTQESSGASADSTQPAAKVDPGFIYGRITTDGTTYEGRLRWGRDQEAFWGDYFNGAKAENTWAVHLPREPGPLEIFGFEIGGDRSVNLNRLFLARFGDILASRRTFEGCRLG